MLNQETQETQETQPQVQPAAPIQAPQSAETSEVSEQSDQERKQTYIESLPTSFTEKELRELVEPFATRGTIDNLIFKKHITGTQTGFGFISYSNQQDADDCQQALNGRYIQDQVIRCGNLFQRSPIKRYVFYANLKLNLAK